MFVGLLKIPNYYNLNKYPYHSRGNPCGCPKITGTYKKISRKYLQKIYIKREIKSKANVFWGHEKRK